MWSPAVVKVEVTPDRIPGLADAFVGPQIHFLIFDAAPQPLDEDVVAPSAPISMNVASPMRAVRGVEVAPVV